MKITCYEFGRGKNFSGNLYNVQEPLVSAYPSLHEESSMYK